MEYEIASSIRCNRQETNGEIALHIARLAAAGDESALLAYDALAEYLSDGLANIFNILDPEAIILSGGLVDSLPTFVQMVRAKLTDLIHFGRKRAPLLLQSAAGIYTGVRGRLFRPLLAWPSGIESESHPL